MLVLGLGLAGSLFSDATTTEFLFISNPESKQANTLLEQRLRGPNPLREVVVVRSADLTVDDPAYQEYVEGLHNEIVGLGSDAVARATNYYQPELPISSCLGPSNAPSSTRAIVVSVTDAVNHPIKLTKPSLGVVS